MEEHHLEEGVSEVVGAMLLIGLTVLGVVLVGITFLSGSQPEEIPHTTIVAGNSTEGRLTLANYGGDPLRVGEYRIYVDYGDGLADRTDEFNEPDDSDGFWSMGEVLVFNCQGTPQRVVVTAISGGGEIIVAEPIFSGGTVQFSPDTGVPLVTPTTTPPAPENTVSITFPGSGNEIPTKDAEILATITSNQTKYVHMILYNYNEMQDLQEGQEIPGGKVTGLNMTPTNMTPTNMTPTDFESIYTSGNISNLNDIGGDGDPIAVVVIAYDENNEPIASLTKKGTLNKNN